MKDLVVEVEQGRVRGKQASDYHGGSFVSFLGIPYAKAPIGELRFKAPQPPEPWTDIRNATKEGWECPSIDMYFAYYVGNEDNCLNLNVHTKQLPDSNSSFKRKPVMVWIHGGAFLYGSNKNDLYGPDYLMTQDIVLVSVNYRLGIFGFLSLKDPALEVPGNAGLKDLTMALRWVQKNIEKFGGDANNVTIFGESAGSASVHYLTLSPLTKGLFHKAIMQSGTTANNWSWGKNNAEEVAKYMGYKGDLDERAILEKLKKESAKNIVSGQFKVDDPMQSSTIRPWGPVVEPPSEGAFLIKHPLEIQKNGENHKIPMIIGYNSLEGMFYELIRRTKYQKLPSDFEKDIPYELNLKPGSEESRQVAGKLKKFYLGEDNCSISEANIEKVYLVKTDTAFVHGIQRSIRYHIQNNGDCPVYAYRMTLEGPLNFFKRFATVKYFKTMFMCNFLSKISPSSLSLIKNGFRALGTKIPEKPIKGVCHADDLYYLFTAFFSPKIEKGSKEDVYIQRFVKLWTNFARTGNPTSENEQVLEGASWRPAKDKENIEFLDLGEQLKMVGNEDEERVKFWDELYKNYSNKWID